MVLSIMITSCEAQQTIYSSTAKAIAYEKVAVAAPSLNVDVSQLPPPTMERQGDKLIYDFKDPGQNAWIVVIVHPNGSAEVSFDEIK